MNMSAQGENRLICLVCCKQFSQYTCPRCNMRYCSLSCYKSHSDRCLESFNRDNVLAHLQDCSATSDTRRRVLAALQRFHSGEEEHTGFLHGDDGDEEEEQDDGCILSERTLEKIASGQEINVADLSPEEQKAFMRAVILGEFSHMIKPWEPWWLNPSVKNLALNRDGNRVVRPLERTEMENTGAMDISDAPQPLDTPLPPVRQLTPKPPSPLLGFHLVEVLYSYCFTLRFYNGDWGSDAFHATSTCLSISQVLGHSASPLTVSEALTSCFEIVCSPFFRSAGGYRFAVALLDDTAALLHMGRPAVVCALSDLHRMIEKAAKDAKDEDMGWGGQKKGRRKAKNFSSSSLKAVCKKVFFLLCWTNEQPVEMFNSLSMLIDAEKAQIVEAQEAGGLMSNKGNGGQTSSKKGFIEELT